VISIFIGKRRVYLRKFGGWRFNFRAWKKIALRYKRFKTYRRVFRYRIGRMVLIRTIFRRGRKTWSTFSLYYFKRRVYFKVSSGWNLNLRFWRILVRTKFTRYLRVRTWINSYSAGRLRIIRIRRMRGSKKWTQL